MKYNEMKYVNIYNIYVESLSRQQFILNWSSSQKELILLAMFMFESQLLQVPLEFLDYMHSEVLCGEALNNQ